MSMRRVRRGSWVLGALPFFLACEAGSDSPVLARAEDHRFTVDEAASLLAAASLFAFPLTLLGALAPLILKLLLLTAPTLYYVLYWGEAAILQ